jgi:hypothetical protein
MVVHISPCKLEDLARGFSRILICCKSPTVALDTTGYDIEGLISNSTDCVRVLVDDSSMLDQEIPESSNVDYLLQVC